MSQIERIAATGEIFVVARLIRLQPIVRGIVDAAKRQRRAEFVAFRRVIVNNVKDDLDARLDAAG